MKKIQHLIGLLVVTVVILLFLPLFDMIYLYPATTRLVLEKVRQDAENLGDYLISESERSDRDVDLQELQQLVTDFNLKEIGIFSDAGKLLLSTATDAEVLKLFPAIDLLKKGHVFSRTVYLPGPIQPLQVVEVQLPVMRSDQLYQIIVLSQDITPFKEKLNRLVSTATIVLLSVAIIVLVIVLLVALMARKAIVRQLDSENRLIENQAQLLSKHKEFEHLFEQVEQAKYEWQLALDCIADMILLIGDDGRIKRCNEALIQFLGCSYLDVLGKSWQQVLFRNQSESIALDRHRCDIYHEHKQLWLLLEFYPFQIKEQLTVVKIQQKEAEK